MNIKSQSFKVNQLSKSSCRNFPYGLKCAPMMKTLIVGMAFLGSLNVWAQPAAVVGGIESLVRKAATSELTAAKITSSLMQNVKNPSSANSAIAQVVKNDPLYVFTNGQLDENALKYLGTDAQQALAKLGRGNVFKGVAESDFNSLAFSTSLDRAAEKVPLSSNGKVPVSVDPDKLIEAEVKSIGLTDNVATELATELKSFRNEVGVSYTNRGMCKGLNDEAAQSFSKFLRDTRTTLKTTRQKCATQFAGAIAANWLLLEKSLGRTGEKLWDATRKVQLCYTGKRMQPSVLLAIDQIQKKHGGALPEGDSVACPL
jgi:hypothetical protein